MTIYFSKNDAKYGCFSNFTLCHIVYEGLSYKSAEAAWQSLKSKDKSIRMSFCNMSPSEAKYKGRRIKLRNDWESVKYDLMVDVLRAKFTQNPEFGQILKSTGDLEIIENTTGWHDNIWGKCSCNECRNKVGQNLLGKALMQVRFELNVM